MPCATAASAISSVEPCEQPPHLALDRHHLEEARRGPCSRCRRRRRSRSAGRACAFRLTPTSAASAGLGHVRLAALGAELSRQPLGDDAVDGGGEHGRVDADVLQPRDRARRAVRVQRRQHEVAGHRGAERDLRGLLVADLADQEHVGVGAEDRAQRRGEREAGLDVDLDLVDAVDLVLDRILDGLDRALVVVQQLERRVEGRRLAAARRAAGDDRPERLRDRTP